MLNKFLERASAISTKVLYISVNVIGEALAQFLDEQYFHTGCKEETSLYGVHKKEGGYSQLITSYSNQPAHPCMALILGFRDGEENMDCSLITLGGQAK